VISNKKMLGRFLSVFFADYQCLIQLKISKFVKARVHATWLPSISDWNELVNSGLIQNCTRSWAKTYDLRFYFKCAWIQNNEKLLLQKKNKFTFWKIQVLFQEHVFRTFFGRRERNVESNCWNHFSGVPKMGEPGPSSSSVSDVSGSPKLCVMGRSRITANKGEIDWQFFLNNWCSWNTFYL